MDRARHGFATGVVRLLLLVNATCKPAIEESEPQPSGTAEVADAAPHAQLQPHGLRVLLFEKETEWFHPSNPVADRAMRAVGVSCGWEVTSSKDSSVFTPSALARFDVVVFLLTSGMVLDATQRDALRGFMASGGGYAGVHSASHTDYDSTYYNGLVGASFKGHPGLLEMNVVVDDPADPIVAVVPSVWRRTDEWYTFQGRPEDNPALHVLLSLDEGSSSSYPGAAFPSWLRVGVHPLAWRQLYGGGRSFYTALGHTPESWSEDAFLRHVVVGIQWAGSGKRS